MTLNDGDPISPAEFGELLRRTREAAGLAVDDIASETKVSTTILNGLERGSFRLLPERVFCRSFVAQYARTIGVDESPLLAAFDAAWEEYALESGSHPNLELMKDDIGPTIRWRFWIPISAGVGILLVAAAVILRGSTSPADGLVPDPRRSGAREAAVVRTLAPVAIPTPEMRSTPTGVVEPEEETTVRMTVEVDAGEECWIHYRDRDGETGQQLVTAGSELALELAGPVKLTVGNAGAVRLTVGDRTYRELGLPGQVIHTEVTATGLPDRGSAASVP